ncbi:MAG: aminotransferase class V-fold PLP-dependent enzyme [Candidatus Omnitrophica bacterium]|jgi:histidine decarboxylase|nr:aminotransferase class V-fold PLP-dependent enzyme [Candidatus Omnitrophota bacterium]
MKKIFRNKTRISIAVVAITFIFSIFYSAQIFSEEIPIERLNKFAKQMHELQKRLVGYPVNQNTELKEFYEWYLGSKLYEVSMNNVGDPRKAGIIGMNTHEFENEVINFFAPLYGFSKDEVWGIVTMSGTDGNSHGMYFGARQLFHQTKMRPICYVSEEAHYSIKRLADVQNLELRLIKADKEGKMIVSEFEKALDPSRPALVVIAMGTTFKGAIDNQAEIDAVIRRKKPIAVYRHVDAALFGGYLPFTENKDLVNRKVVYFDSIAVSGHKFFGFDEPMGIFLTTKKTLNQTNPFEIAYLNQAVPTITCSRSALSPLKFWWKIKRTGMEGFKAQAEIILANAKYMEKELKKINWPVWRGDYSNTVYFKRPGKILMEKYGFAPEFDSRLGGDLAHVVVMQNVSREDVDEIVNDIKTSKK